MSSAGSEMTAARGGRLWELLRYTPMRDVVRGRLSGRLHYHAVIAEAGLPGELAEAVMEVVDGTRLWRLEKAAVAMELVAHFHDGLDGGKDAEEIRGEFGDVRLAARLIRRAQKRKRHWVVRLPRRMAMAAVGLVLLYVGYGVYFHTGSPSPSVNYIEKLNARSQGVAAEDAAWPLYRSALIGLGEAPTFEGIEGEPRPGDVEWAKVEAYLSESSVEMATIREAAGKSGFGFVVGVGFDDADLELWPGLEGGTYGMRGIEDSLIGVQIPYLWEMRKLSKVLAWDARRAAEAGEGETVVADVEALLGIAGHVRETPVLVGDLVSCAIVAVGLEVVGDVLAEESTALSDEQLQRLAHRLGAADELLEVRVEYERYAFYDLVQRMYTDDGSGDGRMTAEGIEVLESVMSWGLTNGSGDERFGPASLRTVIGPAAGAVMMSRRDVVALYDELMDELLREGRIPLWERGPSRVDQRIEELFEGIRTIPVGALLPALGRLSIHQAQGEMQRDGVLVALAAELYRRRHGEWPVSLEAMVPDLLPSVPVDQYTGEAMGYAAVDGKPVVYSRGTDRDDDGGQAGRMGVNGAADVDAAKRWMSAAEVAARKAGAAGGRSRDGVVDGDWVLWPRSR